VVIVCRSRTLFPHDAQPQPRFQAQRPSAIAFATDPAVQMGVVGAGRPVSCYGQQSVYAQPMQPVAIAQPVAQPAVMATVPPMTYPAQGGFQYPQQGYPAQGGGLPVATYVQQR